MLKNPYPKYSEVHSYASIMFFHFLMPYILTTYWFYLQTLFQNTTFEGIILFVEIILYTTTITLINYKTLDWNKYRKEQLVLFYLLLYNQFAFSSGDDAFLYGRHSSFLNIRSNLLIELVNNLTDILSCLPF